MTVSFLHRAFRKVLSLTLCAFCVFVAPAFGQDAAGISEHKLDWYDSWVTRVANDAPPEMYIKDPEELKRVLAQEKEVEDDRRDSIRREPDAILYLKALFWRHYRLPESAAAEGTPSILEALALREDLTEADVADIAAEVDRILASPVSGDGLDRDNYLLVFYAKHITRRLPTAANLDRCVRAFTRSESNDWLIAKLRVLPVLAELGSAETLPLAEQLRDTFKRLGANGLKRGAGNLMAEEAQKQVEVMKARLAEEASGKAIPAAEAALAARKTAPPPAPPPAAAAVPERTSPRWPLWPAVFLLFLPVWLALRKLRGKGGESR